MNENRWKSAATYGLFLALITILYTLIQTILEPKTALALILWVAKFAGSIWLLLYFIKDFASHKEVFSYKDGFRFGVMISFLSSIIAASYMFLHYGFIFSDSIAEQMDSVMNILQSSNPDAVDSFAKIESKLPHIIFIFSLIYWTLFGVIASSIIANYTKKGDLFSNTESKSI